MPQNSYSRKEEILMRSAQSRLGVVSSLSAARKDVGRCVDALPLPGPAFKLGAGVVAGLAGVVLLRALLPTRRRAAAPAPVAAAPAAPRPQVGRLLLSQSVALLLVPLCRHYLLGETSPVAARLAPLLDSVFKKTR